MAILVFDIETIPDVVAGRTLYDLHGLSDEDTARAMFALRRAKVGHDFLPHYLQKICAISLVLSHGSQIKVWSLGDESSDEKELISRFFAGIDNVALKPPSARFTSSIRPFKRMAIVLTMVSPKPAPCAVPRL